MQVMYEHILFMCLICLIICCVHSCNWRDSIPVKKLSGEFELIVSHTITRLSSIGPFSFLFLSCGVC